MYKLEDYEWANRVVSKYPLYDAATIRPVVSERSRQMLSHGIDFFEQGQHEAKEALKARQDWS